MIEYQIPKFVPRTTNKKLQMLDPITLAVLDTFDTITQAEEMTKISMSTISNVLCQGSSAAPYVEAGGFKWEWDNRPNMKYDQQRFHGNN